MKIEVEITTPEPPAKIRTSGGMVDIKELSEPVLKAIAKEWGRLLVEKAKERREQ